MSETLFGGGGGNIPSNRKLRNMDITPLEYMGLRKGLAGTMGQAIGGASPIGMSGIPNYDGQYSAPVTGQENDLIAQIFGRAGQGIDRAGLDGVLSQIAQGGTALQQANQGSLLDTLGGKFLDPSTNPWLAQTVKSAQGDLQYAWDNQIMPNLRASFTGAGQTITPGSNGSSAFDRSVALAGNEQTRQLQDLATELYSNNYTNERSNMMNALGLSQQETAQRAGAQTAGLNAQQGQDAQRLAERQAQTSELTQALQSVALPRLIEQYGMDQGVTEFRNRLNTLLQILNMGVGASGANIANVGMSQPTQGIFGQLMGGTGQMVGGGASLYTALSDRRLKSDILPLGVRAFGVPLYEYRYLWGQRRLWGVMAQEAPEGARIHLPSGYLAVNYAALGA